MFYDVSSLIACVSELVYDLTGVLRMNERSIELRRLQLENEKLNCGELRDFFEGALNVCTSMENLCVAQRIIEKLAGENEQKRWDQLKKRLLVLEGTPQEVCKDCAVAAVTANKKLARALREQGVHVHLHSPRSLCGL